MTAAKFGSVVGAIGTAAVWLIVRPRTCRVRRRSGFWLMCEDGYAYKFDDELAVFVRAAPSTGETTPVTKCERWEQVTTSTAIGRVIESWRVGCDLEEGHDGPHEDHGWVWFYDDAGAFVLDGFPSTFTFKIPGGSTGETTE